MIPRIPPLKHHKGTGQGYARHRGRCVYFGRWQSPECARKYRAWIAGLLESPEADPRTEAVASVSEACDAYLAHARTRYAHPDGTPTGQVGRVGCALRVLRSLFGALPVGKVGARHLDACRREMGRLGWRRTTATSAAACVLRCWAWLVTCGHAHPDALARMRELEPLRPGQYGLAESPPVQAVPEEDYARVLARLTRTNPIVAAMARVQNATGMRPGEVCAMTWDGITGWGEALPVYTPARHKLSHAGVPRHVVLFPDAVEALAGLPEPHSGVCFRPSDVTEARGRSTAHQPGWRSRVLVRARPPGARYTPTSYGVAVRRACQAEGVPVWYPYRLRHCAMTRFRAQFGRAAAQRLLGHAPGSKASARYDHTDELAELLAMLQKAG